MARALGRTVTPTGRPRASTPAAVAAATAADRPALLRWSLVLAGLTVLLQIGYPLAPDRALGGLSVATVLVAVAASLVHGWAGRGGSWTLRLAVVVVAGSFAAEAVGVATGLPFGSYSYAHSLGPLLLGVPVLVPLAWLMMAYPALVLARTLVRPERAGDAGWRRPVLVGLLGGGAMAAWDVFLDPQLVAAGHWTWHDPSPHLPGVDRVPLTNLAGWLVVASALVIVVGLVCPDARAPGRGPATAADTATPVLLLGWTWVGGVVGNAVFFGRPWVALWGGLALGAFVVPYLVRTWREHAA